MLLYLIASVPLPKGLFLSLHHWSFLHVQIKSIFWNIPMLNFLSMHPNFCFSIQREHTWHFLPCILSFYTQVLSSSLDVSPWDKRLQTTLTHILSFYITSKITGTCRVYWKIQAILYTVFTTITKANTFWRLIIQKLPLKTFNKYLLYSQYPLTQLLSWSSHSHSYRRVNSSTERWLVTQLLTGKGST